jgi:hypothetical protein
MFKILREVLTGIDGQSHDLGRYSWLGSFLLITAIAIWHEFRGIAVDLTILAAALGANAVTHAASLFVQRSVEPQPPEEPKS